MGMRGAGRVAGIKGRKSGKGLHNGLTMKNGRWKLGDVGSGKSGCGWEVGKGGHGIRGVKVESEGMIDWELKIGRKQGEKGTTAAIAFLRRHSSVALWHS